MRLSLLVGLTSLATALPRGAAAYSIETGGTPACHEDISIAAWRQMQADSQGTAPALPSRGDDEALIKDVPFTVPKSLRSIGPVTLLLGVRDNDIKHFGPMDLKNLTPAASDPGGQAEHCLRAREHDEPDGTRLAVEECREFIRGRLLRALEGLDEDGKPDGRKREQLKVSLAIRDEIDVDVPIAFLNAGRALHAIQDSFTHSYRNPADPGKITVVLNFVDYTQDTLDEAEDGPAHASELDKCDDADELRAERREWATNASAAALSAVFKPGLELPARKQAIEDMLDQYIAFDEGSNCTFENDWCDAAERQYGSPTLRCGLGYGGSGWVGAALAMVGAGAFWRRRRAVAGSALVALALALPSRAEASEDQGPIDSPAAALAGTSDAAVPGNVDRGGAFFARLAAGGSYDNAAFSGGLGLRYQLSTGWMVGFDGEWNPYIATTPGEVRSGSANAYLSLIRRFQLRYEAVNIRSTLSAGASMLLFDLVGADKYSMGPYFGLSFLGVEWKLGRGFYLTVDPTYIAIAVPSLKGVPFMYKQYRFLVGLEFGG